ncbi:porin family protein [Rhizobacter sp. P5_C2]
MKKILFTALIAMAGSVGAHAEGIYVGVAAGGTNVDVPCNGINDCDKSDTGFKLFGGYKLTENVAVEAHYADYGKAKVSGFGGGNPQASGDAALTGFGFGVALLGDFATDWNGVVRAGIARNKVKVSVTSPGSSFSDSESKTKGYVGAGVGYKLTKEVSLTAAIDYTEGEHNGDKAKATLYTIGVNYSF